MTRWRTRWRRWLTIFGAFLILSTAADFIFGGMVHFDDVSEDPRYVGLVGRRFVSTVEGRIHGVTNERNYRPPIEVYVVTPLPGFGGPEVLSTLKLPKGTVVEVLKVMRCDDCYFDFEKRVELVLRLESVPGLESAKVVTNLENVGSPGALFRPVDSERSTNVRRERFRSSRD
jgi:hypothetical protein